MFVAPALVLGSGWLQVVAVAAIVVVAVAVLRPPPRQWQGALAVGLGIQVLLRLPTGQLGGTRVSGASAAVVALAALPVLASAWLEAAPAARRRAGWAVAVGLGFVLLAAAGLGVAAVSARSGMHRGLQHAERGLDAAESGDQERAADELDQSTAGFDQARHRLGAPWAWPARVVPVLGHYAAAGTLAADAGHDVAAAGASAARQVPYDQLSPKDGKVDLDLLRSVGPPVDAAATELEQAARQVEALDTTWLIPPLTHRLDGLRDDLRKTVPEARRAADAVALAPAMLGGTGTRHYLVLFANPSEARPLGGYVGAYGELTAAGGKLELTRSGRTADLRIPDGPPPEPDPAGFEDRYSRFQPASHLGNVGVSPDFGAVAVESARLYGLALDAHFDGVLYVDPYGLAALLKLTGPITVDGLDEPLTEHNTASFLLLDQYTHFGDRADRFDFLTEASTATFRLLTNAKLPEPRKAFKALYPAVAVGAPALRGLRQGRGRPARPGRAQRLVPRCRWRRPDQRALVQRVAQQDRCLRAPVPALRGHGEPGGRDGRRVGHRPRDQRCAARPARPTCWATVTSSDGASRGGGRSGRTRASCRSTPRSCWTVLNSTAPTSP